MNPTRLQRIHTRDDGVCHLCGGEVAYPSRRRPEVFTKRYATLDHVVPKSQGGRNDDSNLRLAHWACNQLRDDGPVPEEPYPMPGPGVVGARNLRRRRNWAIAKGRYE